MPSRDIYQLKVTLKDIRPPIWRRLQVPGAITFAKLHRALQDALGWTDSHLHQFNVCGTYVGMVDHETFDSLVDERRVRLAQVAEAKTRIVYEYDFGDSWTHEILVEKVLPAEPGVTYPRCVAGKRACPPEDCGGAWGYANLLDALADPNHDQHESMKDWLGGGFDSEDFVLARTNALLQGARRRADRNHAS